MRVFKSTYRDEHGRTHQTQNWYIEFSDSRGRTRRIAAYTSKAASVELGRNLEKLASYARATGGQVDPALQGWVSSLTPDLLKKLASIGLVKSDRVAVNKPLKEHLQDYAKALSAKGGTAKHVDGTVGRVERVFEGCGFKHWDDITASGIQAFLDKLRQPTKQGEELVPGISAQTFNYYLGACKAFCRWMTKDRRAMFSPITHLEPLNVRVDRRRDRRALSEEELRKLVKAARNGEELFGRDRDGIISWRLSGIDRAMLYQLAVETGLRAGEIRSLTPLSFSLGGSLATVTVLAAYSKHRRDDTLPLRPSTAATLGEYLMERDPMKPVFQFPKREDLARILRVDLEAAGIPYRDAAGRVVDFHALRHTFITNLAQGGVHPKTAQALARHSTITLTMDRYSHSDREDEARALDRLPDLNAAGEKVGEETGRPFFSADSSAEQVRPGEDSGDRVRRNGTHARDHGRSRKHGKNSKTQVAPVGVEPTRPEEDLRILSPLRLPFRHGADEDGTGRGRTVAEAATLRSPASRRSDGQPVWVWVRYRRVARPASSTFGWHALVFESMSPCSYVNPGHALEDESMPPGSTRPKPARTEQFHFFLFPALAPARRSARLIFSAVSVLTVCLPVSSCEMVSTRSPARSASCFRVSPPEGGPARWPACGPSTPAGTPPPGSSRRRRARASA